MTAEQKALIQRAAALKGRSLSAFVLASVQDAAQRAIDEHATITLTGDDSRAFAEALLNPPEPNERLKETVRRYRELIGV